MARCSSCSIVYQFMYVGLHNVFDNEIMCGMALGHCCIAKVLAYICKVSCMVCVCVGVCALVVVCGCFGFVNWHVYIHDADGDSK